MKSLDRFIEEAAKSVAPKSCPPGQYYCFTDRKCKKIPNGYRVGYGCLLYTSPSPRDMRRSRMPSSA